MGKGILVLGESGSGKSTSLETLDPKSTFIINIKGKDLPFKGWQNNYTVFSKDNPNGNYLSVWDAGSVIKIMNHISEKMPHIKVIVVDDLQYMSATDLMNRSNEKGFEKFSIIGKNLFDVIDQFNKLRKDLYVIYTNHTDEFIDSSGDRRLKAKTIGERKLAYICLTDWNTLRALYTRLHSNDVNIVKEIKIGQSAAKCPIRMKVQRPSRKGVANLICETAEFIKYIWNTSNNFVYM